MNKIKRKPEAIIKAFEMDSERKAIYVEGKEDRLFFEYLFEDDTKQETLFFEIETVDIPNVDEGGNRQRLLNFAEILNSTDAKIKCFVDTDFSQILKQKLPDGLILTDFRDLEGYLYEKEYFRKFIKVGLKTDKINSDFILTEISKARDIAILRICSEENDLRLPFQRINKNFSRYYKNGGNFNLDKYVLALIQTCEKKHNPEVINKMFNESKELYNTIDNRDLLHGKDVLEIIKEIAKSLNKDKENIELVFWMSFDKTNIENYNNLKDVGKFIN